LQDVETDGGGNVLGWIPGSSPRAMVIAAHLDTVFPAGTDVTVKRARDRLIGPGLVDDTRGLAAVLAIVERQWQEQWGDAFQRGWWRGQHQLCPRCGVELEREVTAERAERGGS
jgi:hypothetical protein